MTMKPFADVLAGRDRREYALHVYRRLLAVLESSNAVESEPLLAHAFTTVADAHAVHARTIELMDAFVPDMQAPIVMVLPPIFVRASYRGVVGVSAAMFLVMHDDGPVLPVAVAHHGSRPEVVDDLVALYSARHDCTLTSDDDVVTHVKL